VKGKDPGTKKARTDTKCKNENGYASMRNFGACREKNRLGKKNQEKKKKQGCVWYEDGGPKGHVKIQSEKEECSQITAKQRGMRLKPETTKKQKKP